MTADREGVNERTLETREPFSSFVPDHLEKRVGRAASLAWLLTLFALAVFALQRWVLGRRGYTTVSGKGDAGVPMPLPRNVRRMVNAIALPWVAFTLVVYLFALAGGFVQTWGRDYTPTLAHFRAAFSLEWGAFGIVWSGTAWNSFFTTVKLAAISRMATVSALALTILTSAAAVPAVIATSTVAAKAKRRQIESIAGSSHRGILEVRRVAGILSQVAMG